MEEGSWHPDPFGRFVLRWWNGAEWTSQVLTPTGEEAIDPSTLGIRISAPTLPQPSRDGPELPTPAIDSTLPAAWTAQQELIGASRTPSFPTVSAAFGVGCLMFALIPFLGVFSVLFSVVGACMSIVGIAVASRRHQEMGRAILGLILSVVALAVWAYVYRSG